jgi:hypothetical protein
MDRSVCSFLLPPRGMFPGEHGIGWLFKPYD